MQKDFKKWILIALLATISAACASAQPYAYVSSWSNTIAVVNSSGTVVSTIRLPGINTAAGVAITPDGNFLYVAGQASANVLVVSTASNSVVATIPVGYTPVELAVSPNGAQVYVVNRASYSVSVISTASNTVVGTVPVASKPMAVAFSPDGSKAYVALYGGSVLIVNTATLATSSFSNGLMQSVSIAIANNHVYVGNQGMGNVTVHDLAGNLLATVSGIVAPSWLAATPDGSRVYATKNNSSAVAVIDTASNSVITTIPTGSVPTSVAVSADGAYAYVTNEYAMNVSQINTATNTVIKNISGVGSYPNSVITSPGNVTPPPPVCTYSLSAPSASFGYGGGSGSVTVTPSASCGSWSVTNVPAWVTITSATTFTGTATVTYTVAGNPSGLQQSAVLSVAGQNYTVSESGAPCTVGLSPSSVNLGSAGGTGSFSVTVPSGCSWSAGSNNGWLQVTGGASGNGNGSVSYLAGANTSSLSQTGTISVGGATFTVVEAGVACTYGLSATSNSFAAIGGTGTVNVTAPTGCTWGASVPGGVSWVTLTGGSTGSGNGTVSYTVTANTLPTQQSTTLTIAAQNYSITEAGLNCSETLSASSTTLGGGTGGGSVNVTAAGSCPWSATSDSPWLSVTPGFSGTGNGTVSFTVTANPGTASRTGNLTIGTASFQVTQSGASFSPIRIHCGGAQVTDTNGNVWAADTQNMANSSTTNVAIANTTSPALYQTDAWSTGTLQYQFSVPNGSFNVTLKFAEVYLMAPGRAFNIVINGSTVAPNFDIYALAGANAAHDQTFTVNVTGGSITIQLVPIAGSTPKINAIQIQ